MAWSKSTKQRRVAARRRGRNGDFKRRFLERASRRVAESESRMASALAHIIWIQGGFTLRDLAGWI